MELKYNHIQSVSQEQIFMKKVFLRHIFCALFIGSNPDFNWCIKNKKDVFDKGKRVGVAELLQD
eukprot:6533140-Ditylum_brightwellii.AAC.1